ncbi:MAG TPA: hypothetical protein VGB30_02020 [bacterium]
MGRFLIPLLVAAIIGIGCSSGDKTPVTPDLSQTPKNLQFETNRYLWGMFDITIDPVANTAEVVPVRQVSDHFNILKFLEKGPCTDCLKITDLTPGPAGVSVDVEITHPFPGTNFYGFDVRGVAIFEGSYFYPEAGVTASEPALGDPSVSNPDGYTTLYNPYTEGSGPGGLQGFYKGKLASDDIPFNILNPFISYSSPLPNPRNLFRPGEKITETFSIYNPDGGKISFGYAIDASWVPPTTTPVTDPENDFPVSANSPEPRVISFAGTDPSLLTTHGNTKHYIVQIEDYQGYNSHYPPMVEAPDLFEGRIEADFISDFGMYSTWDVNVRNEKFAPSGVHNLLISVEDKANDSSPAYLDLTGYQIVNLYVTPGGWVNTYGAGQQDYVRGTAFDQDNNTLYITGQFIDTVDFDPTENFDERSAAGNSDAFIQKLDENGNVIWTRTWGGQWWDSGESVALDQGGNIYVAGFYIGPADFDPTDEVEEHEGYGDWDSFIVKYNPNGELIWARTWGASIWDKALDVAVSSDGVYAAGFFRGTGDLDPGPDIDNHEANPGASYLTKLDLDGNYLWSRLWAGDGEYDDVAYGVTSTNDNQVYVTGVFDGTVDLDTGAGTDSHTTPNLYNDVYISKFDGDGVFQWGAAWGGDYDDWGYAIACIYNAVYVTGDYGVTVDFDPGPDVNEFTAEGERDVFLSKFNPDGEYQWTKSWGGDAIVGNDNDIGYGLGINIEDGHVYVAGIFYGSVDFDPGESVFLQESNGQADFFLNVLDSDGNYLWSSTFGGPMDDYGWCVAADLFGNAYTGGAFADSVDFNPYPEDYIIESNGNLDGYLLKVMDGGGW